MSKSVYILDIFDNKTTGFSTYKNELFYCLEQMNGVVLHQVIFNYPIDEFTIKQNGKIEMLCFPPIKNTTHDEYYKTIGYFFRLFISDSNNTVFILNASPYYDIVVNIKKTHFLSKIIVVIHDFIWASCLLGDVPYFTSLINNKIINQKYDKVHKSYLDGLETFKIVDKIVCLSIDTYRLLLDLYEVEKIKIMLIRNGLRDSYQKISYQDKIHIREKMHIDYEAIIILFVGRIRKQKGAFVLFESFDKILSFNKNCQLVLVGDFYSEDLKYINNSTKSKICFTGSLNEKDLKEWYSVADIGVVSSYYEQCSYSCIEMKMYGLPIVSSDGFGVKNMFNENNSCVAKIGNIQNKIEFANNISNSLVKMLDSEFIRIEMGLKSRIDYMKLYTISRMKDKYCDLLNSI